MTISPGPAGRWLPMLVAAGFPMAVGTFRALALPMNHDVAWLLYLSGQVLDGARLYVDLIEVNPPLAVWLGVPALMLERITGVSHTLLFPILVALGAAGSLIACWRLSRGLVGDRYRVALLSALATALFVVPSGDWGQREHLTLIMTAPYLLAGAVRARGLTLGRRAGWTIGLVAGIGFSLKPHFLLVPIALEAWLIGLRRLVSSVSVAVAAATATYGLLVLVFAHEYLTLMIDMQAIYARYAGPPLWRVAVLWPSMLVVLALPLALVRGPGRELRLVFGIAGGAWWAIVLVQGKGFFYHSLPGLGIVVVLISLSLIALGNRRGSAFLAVVPPLLITQLVAVGAGLQPRGEPERWERIAEVSSIAADGPVLVLSHSHRDSWPAVNKSGARWTSSLPSTWPARPDVGAGQYAAHHTARALANRPVVLVTRRPKSDPLANLLEHPEFQVAWADYVRAESLRHYQVYRHRRAGSTEQAFRWQEVRMTPEEGGLDQGGSPAPWTAVAMGSGLLVFGLQVIGGGRPGLGTMVLTPFEVHGFWRTRFVPYHGAVRVAGREVEGEPEWTGTFEVIAPGDYVWHSGLGVSRPLEVDGAPVGAGGTVRLGSPGIRRLRLPEGGAGMRVLDLPDPPSPGTRPFFRRF